jgi:hypothetical protein
MSKPSYQSHNGLNVQSVQAVSLPKGMDHVFQRTPSVSQPSWGGYFTFQFKTKNLNLDEIILEFNMSALSGLTVSDSGTAAYTPVWFWFDRIDILIGSLQVDSIYPLQNYLYKQLLTPTDEKRSLMNAAAGVLTHATRATKSASTGSWYLPLHTVFDTSSVPLISSTADLEIRVYMSSLANQITLTSGSTSSGTASSTINSCNLITRHSALPQDIVNQTKALQTKTSLHYPFQEVRQQAFTVQSGVTSSTLVLTAITGCVSQFVFAIRPTSATGANQWTFNTTLTEFDLLDGGSTPLLGGQPIRKDQARFILGGRYSNTTFLSETDGAYLYSFSLDPISTYQNSVNLGAYTFRGNEQMILRFSSALGSAVEVVVYALTYSALEMSVNHVKKIPLTC